MILTAAQSGGVPMPNQVEHLDVGDREAQLAVYVPNLDDLAAWSTWLDAPIVTADQVMESGRVHCSVDGVMFDHRLRVICMFIPALDLDGVPA